jgi:hypothetical protein
MQREPGVGDFLRETLSLVGDASRDVGLYILAIGGLGAVGAAFGLEKSTARLIRVGYGFQATNAGANALYGIFAGIAGLVAAYLLLARYLAVRDRLGEGAARFWPYLGMAILSGFAMALGLILLVVPGLVLLVRWSAASGFVIGNRDGVTDSLSASWEATSGHGWPIFWAGVLLFIGIIVASAVVGSVAGVLGTSVWGGVLSAFVQAASTAITLALGIAVYMLVHDDTRKLGEVFA